MKLNELETLLNKSWSRETSSTPEKWSEENIALGQCAVTALVVQDYFGGRLMRGETRYGSHYWNSIDSTVIDFTLHQFPIYTNITNIQERSREYLLSNTDTKKRYKILKKKVMEGVRCLE